MLLLSLSVSTFSFTTTTTMSGDLLNVTLLSLYVCLALGALVSEDLLEVKAVLGGNCTLRCTAKHKPGVRYRAVRWYKVGEEPSPHLNGLLTRDLPNGTTKWYAGVERKVELLGETRNIFLPNLTCSDSGTYRCHLAAPVGQQNRDGQVLLTLTDCPVGLTENPVNPENLVTDAYLVISATAVLIVALVIFLISYSCLKNTLKGRNKTTKKDILLDAPLKPLDKKDLMLIYTLGPKNSTLKHVCV